jgi:hypothetical protein
LNVCLYKILFININCKFELSTISWYTSLHEEREHSKEKETAEITG